MTVMMPKATAMWLIENTTLTFEQIARFCDMHELEVQAIADGDAGNIIGVSPVQNGQLTSDDIKRCEADATKHLRIDESVKRFIDDSKNVKYKYTPLAQRRDRPDAIAWILKNHPEIYDAQICKILRTTKHTIDSIRNKTHLDIINIKPRNPIALGLCSEEQLHNAIEKGNRKLKRSGVEVVEKSADADKITSEDL
jgi:hypothetical protein